MCCLLPGGMGPVLELGGVQSSFQGDFPTGRQQGPGAAFDEDPLVFWFPLAVAWRGHSIEEIGGSWRCWMVGPKVVDMSMSCVQGPE